MKVESPSTKWAVVVLALLGLGLAGCTEVTLQAQFPARRSPNRVGLRVGFMPAVDLRPAYEREGASWRITYLLALPGGVFDETAGADSWGDDDVRLNPKSIHFEEQSVPNLVASFALNATRGTRAFKDVVALNPGGGWDVEDLPALAREAGVEVIIVMELRHLYAMQYTGSEGSYVTHDEWAGVNTIRRVTHSKQKTSLSSKLQSAVLRFHAYDLRAGSPRLVWQKSFVGLHAYAHNEHVEDTAGTALVKCLKSYAAALSGLASFVGTHPP